MELNARRPTGDVGSPGEEAGYRSHWYTGHECLHAPEPRPYRQWREARSDWVTTQRQEDFERMLAAVTPDNPPLASDIRSWDGRATVGQSALTAAVVLMLGAAFAIILAIIEGGAWLADKITDTPGLYLAPRYRPLA